MFSFRSIVAIAPILATALAKVAFTSVPAVAVTGNDYNITWAGGDGEPVTLTLRRGDPANLATVDTIVDGASGGYYIWTVDEDLESASDYALQITQGQSDINYSGLFTITDSTSTSTTGSSAMTASNHTMTATSFGSASGTGTAMSRNGTFSTATLTSSSSHSSSSGATGTSTRSSTSQTSSSQSTSAPSNDAPVRAGSSAALILGIVAAVMLH